MRPAAHQPGPLITQMRQLNLQHAFFCPGAFAENFQNQSRSVDDLAIPQLFQITLLDRRQSAIYDRQPDFFFFDFRADAFGRSLTDEQRSVCFV